MDKILDVFILFLVAVTVYDLLAYPRTRRSDLGRVLGAIEEAGRSGVLQSARLERRHGKLYVVGFGQREQVATEAEGQRIIRRLRNRVVGALTRGEPVPV